MSQLKALRSVSARIGADPLLVQAAGGNTSLKQDGTMWIKASGTWLKDALIKDLFVPVDLAELLVAFKRQSPNCETCQTFVRSDANGNDLRPSIETTVHALMSQRVVLHVHCVNTIAYAILEDAEAQLGLMLGNTKWAFIPYARPGLPLANAIAQRLNPDTNVLILGNHGLVVAADTVADADALLTEVVRLLSLPVRRVPPLDVVELNRLLDGTLYRPAQNAETHALADVNILSMAKDSVYYPDHVVFLGVGVSTNFEATPPLLVIPGRGVAIHQDAKPAVEAMGRCLVDVLRRTPDDAKLRRLTTEEIYALTNWESEKYRQQK